MREVENTNMIAGIQNPSSDPTSPTNGVYFQMVNGQNLVQLRTINSSGSSVGNLLPMVDSAQTKLTFYYDALTGLSAFFNDRLILSRFGLGNIPYDVLMTPWLGAQRTVSGGGDMVIDYVYFARER